MTREAKIGLLVALAFILVIGILLSDHVTSATREPTAPLALIEGAIKGSTSTPGGTAAPALQNPPRLPGEAPAEQSVPYVHNSAPQQQPGAQQGDVIVGLGTPEQPGQPNGQQPQEQVAQQGAGGNDPWADAQSPTIGAADQQQAQPPQQNQMIANSGGEHPVAREAQLFGETLVPANQGSPPGGNTGAAASPMTGVKEYTIQPGDSLSKIVARHLGRYTPANEAIILSLNPRLKASKDRIIVGETLLVPATASAVEELRAATASGGTTQASASDNRTASQSREQATRRNAPAGRDTSADRRQSGSSSRTYVVKAGDTLWSIAQKQLGSGARHKEILALNADKLSGPDELQVGMKIKLP